MPVPDRLRASIACAVLLLAAPAVADDGLEGRQFFEAKIRPVLVEHCYKCHSAQVGRPKGGLRLDTREGLTRGGTSGPVVSPGDPDESLLIQAIARADGVEAMPPRTALPASVVGDFRRWVKMGAPDPRGDSVKTSTADDPLAWWSLKPLKRPDVPGSTGASHPVDAFIEAGLRAKGLTPAPEADRRTLLRRLALDLTGLPPTPDEVQTFLNDERPDAYERQVDRLLASPHMGERWARHWMDAVHFAETHGHDQDRIRPNAWRYRDYLIEAFNRDTPYPRFVQEQLAADVLFPDEPRLTPALGFLAAGPWDESSLRDIRDDSIDRQVGYYLDRDDVVTTVMATLVSTTVHCARCHDHKFDPIPQADYYRLQAVFAGVDKAERAFDPDPAVDRARKAIKARQKALRDRDPALPASLLEPAVQAEVAAWEAQTFALPRPLPVGFPAARPRLSVTASGGSVWVSALPHAVAAVLAVPACERTDAQRRDLAAHFLAGSLERRLAALPPPQFVYAGASEFAPDASHVPPGKPRPVHVLRRGDIRQPGPLAAPGTLSCVPGLKSRFDVDEEGARRAALAEWVTDPANPLTWRSIVNRVWQRHFGRGLVDTPNDFGRMGSTPTHPELLDWLAADFRDGGGSLKALHRRVVTSAAYRRSTRHDPRAAGLDADNRLLWRQNRRRLDAESVRDAILLAAGRLDRTMGGPSVRQFGLSAGVHVTPVVDYDAYDWESPGSGRRAVYRFIFRTLPDPFMDTLDAADASQLTPSRNESVTALQALAMLNNKFVLRQAEHLAAGLDACPGDLAARTDAGFVLVLGRPPTADERREWSAYAGRFGLAAACRLMFNSNEFLYIN